jgi:hypothetical protein
MIYYWLFHRASRNRWALWAWRKWSSLITVHKHVRRGNWAQAWIWTRNLTRHYPNS